MQPLRMEGKKIADKKAEVQYSISTMSMNVAQGEKKKRGSEYDNPSYHGPFERSSHHSYVGGVGSCKKPSSGSHPL